MYHFYFAFIFWVFLVSFVLSCDFFKGFISCIIIFLNVVLLRHVGIQDFFVVGSK